MHCDCPDSYVGYNCETRLLDTSDTGNDVLLITKFEFYYTFNPFYFAM